MTCPECGLAKGEDEFRPARGHGKHPSRTRRCLSCYQARRTEGQRKLREKRRADPAPKTCNRCGETKPSADFIPHRPYCRSCRAAWQRDYIARDRAKANARSKAWRDAGGGRIAKFKAYGITPAIYEAMLEAQGGVCAICGDLPGDRELAVDHDHETGAVRGLLCTRCNPALGMLRDDVDLLARAIKYLNDSRRTVRSA